MTNFPRRVLASLALVCLTLAAGPAAPKGVSYQILFHGFSGGAGVMPTRGLFAGEAENLYGIASEGGASGAGVVFKLAPDGSETVLYAFTGGNDGAIPDGPVTMDNHGNIYGTTYEGGTANLGTVFEIAPDGTETVLHSFAGGTDDGANPQGGVTIGENRRLYGATEWGGANDVGTVFVLHPSGRLRVLHSFAGSDGEGPQGGVILDGQGNIYGATLQGGAGNTGTVYKVAPDGSENVLYAFLNGFDGGLANSGLMMDETGNLYGTTLGGGDDYSGVVFKVTQSGTESVLHSFTGGADGGTPYATMIQDKHGDLYGTAAYGGAYGFGVVFKLAPDGTETVLHSFASGADGDTPYAGLITDPALGGGYLYGTTSGAACYGCGFNGTVYKIKK